MRDYSKRKIDYANRKPKPINYDERLYIKINKDLKIKLYDVAEKNNVSASQMIRSILEDYLLEKK